MIAALPGPCKPPGIPCQTAVLAFGGFPARSDMPPETASNSDPSRSDRSTPARSAAARIVALADECVLCGLCLPHCPTYGLDRSEGESPRGRIMLMKGFAEGRIDPAPAATTYLDHCLACRSCERVCPAQVRFGELLLLGREAQRAAVPAGSRQRALEWLLPRRGWLNLALRIARGLRSVLPGPWRRMPPAPARRAFDPVHAPTAPARGHVALFLGCLGRHYDADTASAAIRLLSRLGFEVHVPRDQTCCGALHRHAGARAAADVLAQRNRQAFTATKPIAILTLASGCHESIAQGFALDAASPPVHDLFDFLAADAQFERLRFRAAKPGARVALHLPCTQRNVLRNAAKIAPMLARVPGLEVVALPETGCCGAAGSHMMTEPTRADALRAPLLDAVAASDAATLCTSNVGCRVHLAVGLETRGLAVPIRHPIELLAEHLE